MFNLELRRKRRAWESEESRHAKAQTEAEGRGLAGNELREEMAPLWSQVVSASEEYQNARSQKIIQEARRLEIPVPEINDTDGTWERGQTFPGRFLTDLGVSNLRAAIRAEQRERYESWSRWIALTIGLIGAATGLVAVVSTLF
ncbi:MAG: hypothetical protein ACE5Q6_07400 [Dehalococcoidia bacterium]